MKYEKEYQEIAHNYLCTDEQYYLNRAEISLDDYFKKNLDYLSSKKILEWGVGLGQNIYHLNGMHYQVKGYDVSKFAVDFCKSKGIDATTKLNPKEQFDIIFCRHVLEHLQNPWDAVRAIRDHLKDGGVLDLIIPCERHLNVSFKPDHNGHLWAWNFRCINNLLGELGFRVIKNEMRTEGDGYHKLMFIKNMWLYNLATKIAGNLRGCRELRIVAIKEETITEKIEKIRKDPKAMKEVKEMLKEMTEK